MNPGSLLQQFLSAEGQAGLFAIGLLVPVAVNVASSVSYSRRKTPGASVVGAAAKGAGIGAALTVVGWLLISTLVLLPVVLVAEFFDYMPPGEYSEKMDGARDQVAEALRVLDRAQPAQATNAELASFFARRVAAEASYAEGREHMQRLAAKRPIPGWIAHSLAALVVLGPALFLASSILFALWPKRNADIGKDVSDPRVTR